MHILVTRQIREAEAFSKMLKNKNIIHSILPSIEIKNIKISEDSINYLLNSDILIFTSKNSFMSVKDIMKNVELNTKKIITIGLPTKLLIENEGYNVEISPKEEYSSEELIKIIKGKDIFNNKKISIIKGEGGRSELQDYFASCNYKYQDIICYKRLAPSNAVSDLDDILKKTTHICITSADIIKNLVGIVGKDKLKKFILIVGNDRIAKECNKLLGINNFIVSRNPSNEEMLETILKTNE
ncbi:MAG: hypothetical protein CMD90_01640 [Gammaproteobacteria bacterium]|nr:hypothetical protein [Gammaproteobacteria bacterium]|tara:strand:- start:1724 stop:2446 length:723 start_codon:yes stop_codon:yes gene_type:complete